MFHKLAEELQARGELVRTLPCRQPIYSKIKILEGRDCVDRKIIAFEPEISGYSLPWADLVVRWLLNEPGKAGEDLSHQWGPTDLLAHFSPELARPGSIPLSLDLIDRSIFNKEGALDLSKRNLDIFYAKKARAFCQDEIVFPKQAIDITDLDVTPRELAKIYKTARTFYYAELTSCTIEALLCGAQVKFIPSSYLPKDPVKDYLASLEAIEFMAEGSVEKFIEVCYQRLGLKRPERVIAYA